MAVCWDKTATVLAATVKLRTNILAGAINKTEVVTLGVLELH